MSDANSGNESDGDIYASYEASPRPDINVDMGKSLSYCNIKTDLSPTIEIDEASPSEDKAAAQAALRHPQDNSFKL
jgi:hypothetical protein